MLTKSHWLLVALFALAHSSCGSVPDRPKGEICAVVSNPSSCVCVDSESGDRSRIISLEQCHGYIAVSPVYYESMEDWIQELINKIRGFPILKSKAQTELNTLKESVDAVRSSVELQNR